jgi:colanic acid/amylovoran biosynthesis glycosyltransferase
LAVRIVYLINQYPAISHSFIRREILALEQLGFEIMRISLRGWDRELIDEQDLLERTRTRYVLRTHPIVLLFGVARVLLVRPIRMLRAIRMAWQMSRLSERPLYVHLAYVAEACCIVHWLRTAGVKHVHAHFGTNPAEVAMLLHILGGPTWSMTVHGPEEYERAPLLGLAEKIRRCSFAVAISSYGRSQLYRLVPSALWSKIHIVHCGLDPMFLNAPETVGPLPKRLLCVARLSPEKGHRFLVEAARRLAAEGVDFKLVIAGDGETRPEIESLIAKYKLADKIKITGWISGKQVLEEILAARALVLASVAEGLPVVIMEAMALRRPTIATFIAGIPELVRTGKDGWLVPASDWVALTDAMRDCLETPSEVIRHMGETARERVLTGHNVDMEAKKLQRLFYSVGSSQPVSKASGTATLKTGSIPAEL